MKNSKYYPWIVVALLWVVAMLNYMDRQMLSTMKAAMEIDIPQLESAINFGKLMAVFLWVYGLASPFAGAVGDKVSRKWLIVGSLLVWSTVTMLMGYCDSYNQIYWLRATMGISEALYIPSALSLIADYHEGKSRSLAIGLHMSGIYVGQAVGGFGATIADAISWQSTFHWFGLIGVVYALILVLSLKEKRCDVAPSSKLLSLGLRNRIAGILKPFPLIFANMTFWVILFYFMSSSLPSWASKNWLPTLLSENLNMPMSAAGPIATISIALASFIGVMIGGTLSDKWVKTNLKGRVYTGAIGLGLMIPSVVSMGLGNSMLVLVVSTLTFGIGFGMYDANNMPIVCQFVSTRQRASAYGLLNMAGVFAGAVVTDVFGRWAQGGNLGMGFVCLSGITALALVLMLWRLNPTTDNME